MSGTTAVLGAWLAAFVRSPAGVPRAGSPRVVLAAVARAAPVFPRLVADAAAVRRFSRAVERVTAAAVLVLGVGTVVVRVLYPAFPQLARAFPPGWTALAAFIALVLAAHLVHSVAPGWGVLVVVLVTLTGLSVVLDLPNHLPKPSGAEAGPVIAQQVAYGVLAVAVLLLTTKVVLLRRFACRAYHRPADGPLPALLPTQEQDLLELERRLRRSDSGLDERVIPIDGRRGEGKSFLLRYLREKWALQPDAPALAIVDVWQQQTEVDLQVSIVEAVLSQPHTLRRLNWMRVPATFLFARATAHLRNSASAIKVKLLAKSAQAQSSVETDLRLPRLNWQRLFEKIIRKPQTVVIVLDEIDRAVPDVAQAAMTMARRSVDVPGVVVVLPYIRQMVRYKVFNPAFPTLPDLAASMDAVLFDRVPDGVVLATRWDDAQSNTPRPAGSAPAPRPPSWDALHPLLAAGFLRADSATRRQLQTTFEEKYLGTAGIRLRPVEADDVAALLETLPDLAHAVHTLLGSPLDDLSRAALGAAVRRGVRGRVRRDTRGRPSVQVPPLRVLISALHTVFTAAARRVRPGTTYTPEVLAVLAVVALDWAALRQGDTQPEES